MFGARRRKVPLLSGERVKFAREDHTLFDEGGAVPRLAGTKREDA